MTKIFDKVNRGKVDFRDFDQTFECANALYKQFDKVFSSTTLDEAAKKEARAQFIADVASITRLAHTQGHYHLLLHQLGERQEWIDGYHDDLEKIKDKPELSVIAGPRMN